LLYHIICSRASMQQLRFNELTAVAVKYTENIHATAAISAKIAYAAAVEAYHPLQQIVT